MLYFLLFSSVIIAIFCMIYLIFLQNAALRVERLKQIAYFQENSQYCAEIRESLQKKRDFSAKRLSFAAAFEANDRILCGNSLSFENLLRNREILGTSPKKTANFNSSAAENRRNLLEIDLSQEKCSYFSYFAENVGKTQENSAKFKEKARKTRTFLDENKENVDFNRKTRVF